MGCLYYLLIAYMLSLSFGNIIYIIIIIIICYEQALSVSQLKALGPDNAAAITTSQRAALGVEQRAAVDEAVGLAAQKSEITTTLPQKGGM